MSCMRWKACLRFSLLLTAKMLMRVFLKGVWQFCSYLFWPQWDIVIVIDQEIFDELTAQSKDSPRLRMYFDMQNSASDGIQRMLNAIK